MFKQAGDRGGTGIDRFFTKIVGGWANIAYRQANTAYNQANLAFNQANTANLTAIANNGIYRASRSQLNFIPGSGMTINADDDSAANRINVTLSASGSDPGPAFNQANTAYNNANATLVVTATTPSPVRANSLYWNSELGRLYIQYKDADSSQFVEVAPSPLTLRDSGAAAGTYGGIDSSNTISITVDTKGRVTAISNTPATLMRFTTATTAGVNTAAQSQNWFPTTGNVTVQAGTTYLVDGLLAIVDTATTHTQSILFGGTATFDWFTIDILHVDGTNNATKISSSAASAIGKMRWEGTDAATARVLNATSTVGQHWTKINGIIVVNAGGTITPRFQVSAVGAAIAGYPAGVNIRPGTYFSLFPIGANTATAIGPWSA